MTETIMAHKTTILEKTIDAPLAQVFDAFVDPEKKAQWNSPSPEVEIKLEEATFSEGGREVALCLAGGETVAKVTAYYHDIVQDGRIVFTEIIEGAETREGISLVSIQFEPHLNGTKLTATLQIAALNGSGLEEEIKEGWAAALDSLERLVQAG